MSPLRLRAPADLLAALPYLVSQPLDDALVALVVGEGHVLGILYGGLDHLDHVLTPERSGGAAVSAALAADGSALLVAGFGQPERVTPHIHSLLQAARVRGVRVLEALRVTGGRYWSYLCQDLGCCPDEGTRFDPDTSPVPAEAVLRGLVPGDPGPSARIRFLLDPVRGKLREAVAEAATAAEEEASEGDGARRRTPEVLDALREERRRRVTDPRTLGRLGVHLTGLRVRDAVWTRITPETARLHMRLWSRLVRHVPERHLPAPAALLAVAAWQHDDHDLARAALDLALKADPGYAMAVLMSRALRWGLPAERWRGFLAQRLDHQSEEEVGAEDEADPSRPTRTPIPLSSTTGAAAPGATSRVGQGMPSSSAPPGHERKWWRLGPRGERQRCPWLAD
ncbi:DUF4192 domain-containing protein [Nocardiopsis metallicus]|uniref:DUF4192 domain-containing protein n=1 Tax=Nocardiopsis metallicus TaxID=179819 RepID=A0A840WK22_9ACTN|nr:DUF4192 domain-containing protein [Nocardiopsis metallicus]MBB5492195.1 hypothetical protein [Nocardiopsis metallicus]